MGACRLARSSSSPLGLLRGNAKGRGDTMLGAASRVKVLGLLALELLGRPDRVAERECTLRIVQIFR